jgi:hypothetical protein
VFTATVADIAPTGSIDFRNGGTSIAPTPSNGGSSSAHRRAARLDSHRKRHHRSLRGRWNNVGSTSPVLTGRERSRAGATDAAACSVAQDAWRGRHVRPVAVAGADQPDH